MTLSNSRYNSLMLDQPRRRAPDGTRPHLICVRVSAEALAYLDTLAEKEHRTRSDMMRILLAAGAATR